MARRNIVPKLGGKTSEGNLVFTPSQWLERLSQFTKGDDKMYIAPLLKRDAGLENKNKRFNKISSSDPKHSKR